MSSGLNVNFDLLDECIANLKSVSQGVGGDEIRKLIDKLDDEFSNSNSDATNALKARKTEYNNVNNQLINLAANGISMLEVAKKIYKHEEEVMTAVMKAEQN
ncbi:MAG: hypothetical protein IJO70_07045 [Lachnospiraceae bacterium]|nr:hypothetical protein [Lachnospiraceae bacterium]